MKITISKVDGSISVYVDDEEISPHAPILESLTLKLKRATHQLAEVVAANGGTKLPLSKEYTMASPVLQELADQVAQTNTVIGSAVTLINGFSNRIQTAVDEALANGATAEQLAPITDEVAAMRDSTKQLADAVAANTGK